MRVHLFLKLTFYCWVVISFTKDWVQHTKRHLPSSVSSPLFLQQIFLPPSLCPSVSPPNWNKFEGRLTLTEHSGQGLCLVVFLVFVRKRQLLKALLHYSYILRLYSLQTAYKETALCLLCWSKFWQRLFLSGKPRESSRLFVLHCFFCLSCEAGLA